MKAIELNKDFDLIERQIMIQILKGLEKKHEYTPDKKNQIIIQILKAIELNKDFDLIERRIIIQILKTLEIRTRIMSSH